MDINSCRLDIYDHIEKVRKYLRIFTDKLTDRGLLHDASKLTAPELQLFADHSDNIFQLEYGSEEYKKNLKELQPALEHHYAVNRHHPQHFPDGIEGMNLVDIMEMIADWKASSERYKNGNLLKSIELNAERFGIDNQLKQIMLNTIKMLEEQEQ